MNRLRYLFQPDEGESTYWLTRYWLLKGLGLVYLCAFVPMLWQLPGLIGSRGITPLAQYLPRVETHFGHKFSTWFFDFPSVFWINSSDAFIIFVVSLGIFLSLIVLIGRASGLILFVLWVLQLSFTYAGQQWYSFGWEMNLLELGFLSIFLVPFVKSNSFSKSDPPPKVIIYLIRWCLFRLVLGAGLIKIRGDACWTDLSCLVYHYETQPIPNPLSWYFHQAPVRFHKGGVLFNHFVELILPVFLIYPNRKLRNPASIVWVLFQFVLIASGNLGWINILAIVNTLAQFDDEFYKKFSPSHVRERYELLKHVTEGNRLFKWVRYTVCLQVLILSIRPVGNLISPNQVMNQSFDPYHFVNTYGMFGGVTKERFEIIFEASMDGQNWEPYEFKCKPGDLNKRPCLMTPSHYRLDWQMWFAAMGPPERSPWLQNLVIRLLQAEPAVLNLLDKAPFGLEKPKSIRAQYYRYYFTEVGDKGWWTRSYQGQYFPEMALTPVRNTR